MQETCESRRSGDTDDNSSAAYAAEKAAAPTIEAPRAVAPIALNASGILSPTDSAEMFRMSRMMLNTGAVPACFQTPEQVMLAIQMLHGLGVSPALGIRQVMVIPKSQTLAIWGELPKAACQKGIETFEEFAFDVEYNRICFENKNLDAGVVGYVTRVKRKGLDTVYESFFTVERAKTAGLWGKSGPWQTYPDRMLQMRSRSRALKDAFPDVLSGTAIAEYDFNILDGRGEPTYGEGNSAGKRLADKIDALGVESVNAS